MLIVQFLFTNYDFKLNTVNYLFCKMAINTTLIERFVDNIGTANNTLSVKDLGLKRTLSKKFATMLGGVKSKTVTIKNHSYVLTTQGAIAMIQSMEEGKNLAPSYDDSGNIDINTDVTKDTVVFGGDFESKKTITIDGNSTPAPSHQEVSGKNVIIYDASIKDFSCVTLKSSNSIVVEGCTIDNTNGKLSNGLRGADANHYGNKSNSPLLVSSNPKSIVFKDLKIYASDQNGDQKLYNGIELTGGDATKEILIENCQFLGFFNHVPLSLYKYGDNCVVTIRNCYFEISENVFRLSNDTNSTGLILNFENCVFETWDGAPNKEGGIYPENGTFSTTENPNNYAGLCICQDYTSKNTATASHTAAAIAAENNFFGLDANNKPKVTINVKNCAGPTGNLMPKENYADYCMTGAADQLCYVYADKVGCIPFSTSRYPVVNVEFTAAPTVTKAEVEVQQTND